MEFSLNCSKSVYFFHFTLFVITISFPVLKKTKVNKHKRYFFQCVLLVLVFRPNDPLIKQTNKFKYIATEQQLPLLPTSISHGQSFHH